MKISGFTIVRNALLLNYPLRESLNSILSLCDEVIICVGDSQDDTLTLCRNLNLAHPKIRVIETKWDTVGQKEGAQLSHQTNFSLSQCKNPWAFYLQADEVVHETDYESIRSAVHEASRNSNIDGLAFDYVHFYGDYRHTISGRSWYRREVRLIKTGVGIQSFRDAQGFRRDGKPIRVNLCRARVFHYGYIRSSAQLKTKSEEMSHWWGKSSGSDFRLRRHIGIRKFRESHPAVMAERINNYKNSFEPKNHPRVWDRKEIKDLLTMIWEAVVPFRIGEFKNYVVEKG